MRIVKSARQRRATSLFTILTVLTVVLPGTIARPVRAVASDVVRMSVNSTGAQGNAHSRGGVVSGNGRFVVFTSYASNLVTDDTNGVADVFVRDRDTDRDGILDEAGAVAASHVSVDSAGTEGKRASYGYSITFDGRFVIFSSDSTNLVAGDTNNAPDVFVRDRDTDADGVFDEQDAATTNRVSISDQGEQADAVTQGATISGDGRYVAFVSYASNLIEGGINEARNVFVHDRDADGDGGFDEAGAITTKAVSADGAGNQADRASTDPHIVNGFVAFTSAGSNLVGDDTNGYTDVFVARLESGVDVDTIAPHTIISTGPGTYTDSATTRLSYWATEVGMNFECRLDAAAWTACDAAGQTYTGLAAGEHRFDVRAHDASGNLDRTPATRVWTVFVSPPNTTITAGPTGLVGSTSASLSYTSSEVRASFECRLDGASFGPCENVGATYIGLADGRHRFEVRARDAAGQFDLTPARQVWTVDATPPQTTVTGAPPVISTSASAQFSYTTNEAGASFECSLDGAVPEACSAEGTGYTDLAEGVHSFQIRAVDAAGNADASPASHRWTIDLDARPTTVGGIARASLSSTGEQANRWSEASALSADGRFVVFSSYASNLVSNDTNEQDDIFVRDCDTDADGVFDEADANSTTRVNLDSAGNPTMGYAGSPAISVDGRFVTFHSYAPNLVAHDTNRVGDVFVHDRDMDADGVFDEPDATALVLVSASHTSGQENGNSSTPAISADGRFVAFQSSASNLVSNDTNRQTDVFVRDRDTDADGVFDEPSAAATTRIEFDGAAAGMTAYHEPHSPDISLDGRFVVFNVYYVKHRPDGTSYGVYDAFVRDRDSDVDGVFDEADAIATTMVSVDSAGNSSGNSGAGYSRAQEISADGRFVVFVSRASKLVTTDTNGHLDVFVRDRDTDADGIFDEVDGVTTILASAAAGGSGADSESSLPSFGGGYIAFQSWATNLVAGDTNNASDIFVVKLDAKASVDKIAPNTAITSAPPKLASSAARFTYSATEPGPTFECSLDDAAFVACPATGQAYSGLADGAHQFEVRARDVSGNVDATPATWIWTVDATAPATTITTGPTSTVRNSTVTFKFASTESNSTFQCSLNGAAFGACVSPKQYAELADGAYTFAYARPTGPATLTRLQPAIPGSSTQSHLRAR